MFLNGFWIAFMPYHIAFDLNFYHRCPLRIDFDTYQSLGYHEAYSRFSLIKGISITAVKAFTSPALFLTPLMKQNKTEAQLASHVDPKNFLGVTSYSGFLTVDERYNSSLFFWYFPLPNDTTTQWIIWLQGGPGASSLVGLFSEMGPFEYADIQLKLRKTSWCKQFSMVFIDNPVGAGFSFTDNVEGYSKNSDMAMQAFESLKAFH